MTAQRMDDGLLLPNGGLIISEVQEGESVAKSVGPKADRADHSLVALTPSADLQRDRRAADKFVVKLLRLTGAVLWLARPGGDNEFIRPAGWQKLTTAGNHERLKHFRPGMAICLNTGGVVAVVDVDPRNGGDVAKVDQLLVTLGVRVFGAVVTPSGGKHFYVAGHADLRSVHSGASNPKLPGFPGVDIQSSGCNVFLPRTQRPKYKGAGYAVELDELDALADERRTAGTESLVRWVNEHFAGKSKSQSKKSRSPSIDQLSDAASRNEAKKPDRREQAYLDSLLTQAVKRIACSQPGERNNNLYQAALQCSSFVAGAGMDSDKMITELRRAAEECGLVADDGQAAVEATIMSALRVGFAHPRAVPQRTADARSGTGQRIVTLTPMARIVDDIPDWAWSYDNKGRIQRGTLAIFAGRPGAGKSTALRWTAAQFTRGEFDGCWSGTPQNVAYISGAEESLKYNIKPGVRAAGADIDRLFFPRITRGDSEVSLSSLDDEESLTEELLAYGVTVVLVDPVMSTIGGGVDIHRNNETRQYLEPWARIAEHIEGVVIGVAHLTKNNNRDVVAAINGSSAFGEVPRAVFGFAKDHQSEQSHRVMSQAKNSAGYEDLSLAYTIEPVAVGTDSGREAEVGTFRIVGVSERTVSDILGESGRAVDTRVDEAELWLADFLQSQTASSEVKSEAEKAGFSARTVQRAATKLGVRVSQEGFPRRTYWSPSVAPESRQDKNVGVTGASDEPQPALSREEH
jgi:hypothetical protein